MLFALPPLPLSASSKAGLLKLACSLSRLDTYEYCYRR